MRWCCPCCSSPHYDQFNPSVSSPLHLILQAPRPVRDHQWTRAQDKPNKKTRDQFCQVCHLWVGGGNSSAVRCSFCRLTAHPQCSANFKKSQQQREGEAQHQRQQTFEPRIAKKQSASSSFCADSDSVAASTALQQFLIIALYKDWKFVEDLIAISTANNNATTVESEGEGNPTTPEIRITTPIDSVSESERIKYLDGPIDGALYAIVGPSKKPPSSVSEVDSGISLDGMKELDRLLSALVAEAASIPEVKVKKEENQRSQAIKRSASHVETRLKNVEEIPKRRTASESEDADGWLRNQMLRLQTKKNNSINSQSNSSYNAKNKQNSFLAELKASLGGRESEDESNQIHHHPKSPPTPYFNTSQAQREQQQLKHEEKVVHPPQEFLYAQTPTRTTSSRQSNMSNDIYSTGNNNSFVGRGGSSDFEDSRVTTPVNPRPVNVGEACVNFARDVSPFWYKPTASREETVGRLRRHPAGTFLVRNSNSFPCAFGLAVKVGFEDDEDAVRHFLIEPTKYGVRLRGSTIEPVFGSLSALVYAHSIDPLALPCPLLLPQNDNVFPSGERQSATAQLLSHGAQCNLLFLGEVGVEWLSGELAVERGVDALLNSAPSPLLVSLRLSKNGISITDVHRKRFFRVHFPLEGLSHASLDPKGRSLNGRKLFAVIATKPNIGNQNLALVFVEFEDAQPASAICGFFQRVLQWT